MYIEIDKGKKRTTAVQIYLQFREKILRGELKSGMRLPSTRSLSEEIHVARNTILTAYEMLISEEFAVSSPGAGIFVSSETAGLPCLEPQPEEMIFTSTSDIWLTTDQINFDSGIPDLSLFPRGKWNRVVSNAFLDAPISALGYDDPQGRPELRRAVAALLNRTRGIRCAADQILITSGAKQGLTLTAKCLLNADSTVFLEDPTNLNVRKIFSYHTANIIPIPVDHAGIITDTLPDDSKPALLFTTPSHQFPMGGTLPLQRRLALAQFAKKSGCYLVEDDYDSEFRYDGAPIRSLFELDNSHVIYTGTFSKTMFPSLRLGYLVLPHHLVGQFLEWKRLADHHSNSIFQLALARFIENGEFEKHIARMKKKYFSRRIEMISMLNEIFPNQIQIYGEAAGIHIVAGFRGIEFTSDLIDRVRSEGIYVVPVENHSIMGGHKDQVILGFAQLCPDEMKKGLLALKQCINM